MNPETMSEPQQQAGYWCVVCGRCLPEDDFGVVAHDDIPHPREMNFADEDHPQ